MRSIDPRAAGPLNPVLALLYGVLIALVVGYALSYAFAHFGLGILRPADGAGGGPAVFSRAGLNLYAAQHITLVGKGQIASAVDPSTPTSTSARVVLPLTLWVLIPVCALLLAGYASARLRSGSGRWGMIVPAVAGGLLYGLALAALAGLLSARIGSFAMPEIGGLAANPPDITFRPDVRSTVTFAICFGVLFTYLGALIAVRGVDRDAEPGRWWAAGKASILIALVVQGVLFGAGTWFALKAKPADAGGPRPRTVEILPAAAALGYVMLHDGSVTALAESRIATLNRTQRQFYAKANLYTGIVREELGKRSESDAPVPIAAIAAFVALTVMLAGYLAARWGARGGSIPAAMRIAVIHTSYLAALCAVCGMRLVQRDPVSTFAITITPALGLWLLYSFAGVLVLSCIGAHIANKQLMHVRT